MSEAGEKAVPKPQWKPGPFYYTAVYYPRRGRRGFVVKNDKGEELRFHTETMAILVAKKHWEESQKLIAAGEFKGGDGR